MIYAASNALILWHISVIVFGLPSRLYSTKFGAEVTKIKLKNNVLSFRASSFLVSNSQVHADKNVVIVHTKSCNNRGACMIACHFQCFPEFQRMRMSPENI